MSVRPALFKRSDALALTNERTRCGAGGEAFVEPTGATGRTFRSCRALTVDAQCVYAMRMSRVNVYLPDDLAAEARSAGLNLSSLAQEAIRSALASESLDTWLSTVTELKAVDVDHEEVIGAVHAAKDELEGE